MHSSLDYFFNAPAFLRCCNILKRKGVNKRTQGAWGKSAEFEAFWGGSAGVPGGFRGVPQGLRGVPGCSACATTISFATSEAGGSFPIIILKGKTQRKHKARFPLNFTSEGL